jgi:hypothetical protein
MVGACKPSHFQASDLPLLCRFAEASALAEQAAAKAFAEGLLDEDDKPSPWLAIHGQMVKAMSALAMRLRLSPQARQPNRPTRPPSAVSYYERVALERANDARRARGGDRRSVSVDTRWSDEELKPRSAEGRRPPAT